MKYALLAAVTLLALAACGRISDFPVDCPDIVPVAVRVAAQDSITGANVTPGATLVLRDAAYSDSVVAPPVVTLVGLGGNRAGTYAVTVRQSGYLTWTKTEVKVEEGECGARTVELVARLKPSD